MTRILGLSGSLRRQSFNTRLLRAAAELAPDGVDIELATLAGIPLYDADLEARDGIPDAVAELRRRIAASDALLIATPEYNNGIPGVAKNGIDWLSRRPDDKPHVFVDLKVAVIGASPGGFGTILAQGAWLPVLRTLQARQWFGGRLQVSRAGKVFADDGGLADDDIRDRLEKFLAGFTEFVRR